MEVLDGRKQYVQRDALELRGARSNHGCMVWCTFWELEEQFYMNLTVSERGVSRDLNQGLVV